VVGRCLNPAAARQWQAPATYEALHARRSSDTVSAGSVGAKAGLAELGIRAWNSGLLKSRT